MSHIAIRAENLSKSYQITHSGNRGGYKTLQEDMLRLLKRPFNKSEQVSSRETFWALKDVSFEVKHGEVLGIIGRNGAGKSTLLKILSRITKPTTGRADIYGRTGSLLEVGTGFHPELTGRENIFLNGAVLGMTRRDIQKHFDEIVTFAEIEQFLDTPVKRYSSGMYMRLAFAVAAHLEPEVLIIDEVLAVGDAKFQEKCLGKMSEVAKGGRTVLFVSHNMAAVQQLCQNAILLESGRIKLYDEVYLAVKAYLSSGNIGQGEVDLTQVHARQGDGKARFSWAGLRNTRGEIAQEFSIGDDITLAMAIQFKGSLPETKLAVEIRTSDGLAIAHVIDIDSQFQLIPRRDCEVVTLQFKDFRLYPDTYYISLWAGSTNSSDVYDYVKDCLKFTIIDGGKLTMRSLLRHAGLIFLTPTWSQQSFAE